MSPLCAYRESQPLNAALAIDAPMSLPHETAGGPPSPPPPRRLSAGTGVEADDGVACTAMCLYLPRLSKKKRPARRSASARRVASWWPWSPSHHAASGSGDAAAAGALTPHDDDDGSASFKHWGQPQRRRSQLTAPRVPSSSSSFSFPSSPASASSPSPSLVSTAKSGQDR